MLRQTRSKSKKPSSFTARLDSKGRITVGHIAKGVSSFVVTLKQDGSLVLVPQVEIPAREIWLHQNPKALQSLKNGLKDSANKRLVSRGTFAKHLSSNQDE